VRELGIPHLAAPGQPEDADCDKHRQCHKNHGQEDDMQRPGGRENGHGLALSGVRRLGDTGFRSGIIAGIVEPRTVHPLGKLRRSVLMMNLICPPTMVAHAQKVLKGEYEIPYQHPRPVILDIGANIGSFAVWAIGRWPGCLIQCYEPLPANFELLEQNLANVEGATVTLHNFAIGNPARTRLFLGKNNCGEASFFDLGEQTAESVEVVAKSPDVLPRANILKVDAEGSEIEILGGIETIDFDAVLLEYHSDQNRREADALLRDYLLVGGEIRGLHRGVLKYLHRRLMRPEGRGACDAPSMASGPLQCR
jgi:FkbM family methyltransferase